LEGDNALADKPLNAASFTTAISKVAGHLRIDAERVEIRDSTGRPIPVLREGKPIPELTARDS